ncbi:unnamed protein product [Vicia faba]|uniref:Uncharacterized protein n=1 Tax=Vicia faba TaxID=3906 RepID=A0AAV0YNS9_VICFA|nr:unnamed protein product [Vicia faba]
MATQTIKRKPLVVVCRDRNMLEVGNGLYANFVVAAVEGREGTSILLRFQFFQVFAFPFKFNPNLYFLGRWSGGRRTSSIMFEGFGLPLVHVLEFVKLVDNDLKRHDVDYNKSGRSKKVSDRTQGNITG